MGPNVRFLVATATSLLDPERADGFYMCGSHCGGGGVVAT